MQDIVNALMTLGYVPGSCFLFQDLVVFLLRAILRGLPTVVFLTCDSVGVAATFSEGPHYKNMRLKLYTPPNNNRFF